MRTHVAYGEAKDGVSNEAALTLVYDCIADDAMERLKKVLRGRKPRVVAVHAEEARGRNKIPMAYAEVVASILRLDTDPGIYQVTVANHTDAPTIWHRFVSQPLFGGYVEAGTEYLIVDDTCTAGGTLANLKGFIETKGGIVIAMAVLALRQPELSYDISLAEMTAIRLRRRHPEVDPYWREEFGYGVECLTEGEAGHVYSAPSIGAIRNRVAEARRDRNVPGNEAADTGEVSAAEKVHDGLNEAGGAAGGGIVSLDGRRQRGAT